MVASDGVRVRVEGGRFRVGELGSAPRASPGGDVTGLIAVLDRGADVLTGTGDGMVLVTVTALTEAPDGWAQDRWFDEVVEESVRSTTGALRVRSATDEPVAALPPLTAAGPGRYRLRVHAAGRDGAGRCGAAGREGGPDEEYYLLGAWPEAPSPGTIILGTDRVGEVRRKEPSRHPADPDEALRRNLIRGARAAHLD